MGLAASVGVQSGALASPIPVMPVPLSVLFCAAAVADVAAVAASSAAVLFLSSSLLLSADLFLSFLDFPFDSGTATFSAFGVGGGIVPGTRSP